jgi:ABC-2 type transport system ATP-binding protein
MKDQKENNLPKLEPAVVVDNVTKSFKIHHSSKSNNLKSRFLNPLDKSETEIFTALKNISFTINKGEFFGIVGRNGSGKSTLLKIIAGIYTPTKGKVTVNGALVPFIELGVGFNPELTGRENVYLNGAMLGFNRKDMDSMYDEIVEFAELERFMDTKLKNYSSGMQVRLAFSLAIRAKGDILLLDEVLAVGDTQFQRKCFNYFEQLKRNKKTVILVSHSMDMIRKYCDRAAIIDQSILKNIGRTDIITYDYDQLFTNNTNMSIEKNVEKIKPTNRWGNKKIEFRSISMKNDSSKIYGTFSVQSNVDKIEPIFGYSVRNESGEFLFGTNTEIQQEQIKPFKKDEIRKFTWEFPNILANGSFYFDLAAVDKDYEDLDRWNEAKKITISKPHETPYKVNPETIFKEVL